MAQQFFDGVELEAGGALTMKATDGQKKVVITTPALDNDVAFAWPAVTGEAGQVLHAGIGGATAWVTLAQTRCATNWIAADGTTKAITHGLGTQDVVVQLYDIGTGASIEADIERPDAATVVLRSVIPPTGQGWRVLVFA